MEIPESSLGHLTKGSGALGLGGFLLPSHEFGQQWTLLNKVRASGIKCYHFYTVVSLRDSLVFSIIVYVGKHKERNQSHVQRLLKQRVW